MEALLDIFDGENIFGVFLKLFGIVLGLLYLFFSIILLKQVQSMKKVVSVHDSGLLLMMAYMQIGISFVIVAYALFIL
jgi:hypothetical protein